MATTNYLAIDLGSSNGRVLHAQWDGARFTLHELHRFWNGPINIMGTLHWDVLGLWAGVQEGLARYAAQHNAPLAGVAVDTWGVDFALLDAEGRMLGNPVCYRDARTEGALEQMVALVPRNDIFAITGIQFTRINTLYQLWSLRDDEQLAAAHTLLMMPDLFHYWLTGQRTAEYTQASTSQCLHAHERRWATELLERLRLPTHILPPILQPGSIVGRVRREVAQDVGLAQHTPVIAPGSHDTASAVAAVPHLDAQSVYISSGTWSLVGVEAAAPIINEQTLRLNFTNEGGVGGKIRLLKNVMGLWLMQECRARWRRAGRDYSWQELLAAAEAAPPFAHIIDPDDNSLLSPLDMPQAIAAYCARTGQPVPTTVGATIRCCFESLVLRYRWVVEACETLVGHPLATIRIVGGGSQNELLCQLTADACGRPVVAGPLEATALGNVLVQAIATGELRDLAEGRAAIARSVELRSYAPRPSAAWGEAYARFVQLVG